MTKLLFTLFVAVPGAAVYAAGSGDAAPVFTVRWLTPCAPACASNPFGITENGTISGNVATPQGERGFLLERNGSLVLVDTPGNFLIELMKGNNAGDFVGNYFSPADFLVHAFVRDRTGGMRDFVYPGAAVTVAGGITNSGDVVGSFTTDPTTAVGWISFVERNGRFPLRFQFPDAHASGTIALGINQPGDIVGVFTLAGSDALHAFERTRHGGFVEITFAAARETYLADMNESGAATGFWRDQSGVYQGLLFAKGMCRSVDPPPGPHGYTNTTLTGINNATEIVGVSFAAAPGDGDGFLLTPHDRAIGSGAVVPGPAIPCAVPRF